MIDIIYRDKAINWLNSKRDFAEGIAIMQEARFRPGVVRKLAREEHRPGAMERMLVNMRALVSAFTTTADDSIHEDTDAVLHVFEGVEDVPSAAPEAEAGILSHENDAGNLGIVVKRYADLYRQRDRAFNQMKQVGEKNDEASCILRKQLSEQIESCTDQMEKLYPYYQTFAETGEQPSDDAIASLESVGSESQSLSAPVSDSDTKDYSQLTKEELTKEQYNIAKRIARTRNKILYQSENKLDAENPLPEGSAKRIKLEKRIDKLEQELERVKVLIAEMS